MHLTEDAIERLIDGELAAATASDAARHLAACAECAAAVKRARDEVAGIAVGVARLDHALPTVDPNGIIRRVESNRIRRYRLAASVALFLGVATAAAALPGSPVRSWLGLQPKHEPAVPPAVSPTPPPPPAAGIAVAPGQSLTIVLEAPLGGVVAVVELVQSGEVVVSTTTSGTTFSSGVDTLRVDNLEGGAVVSIAVPQAAPRVLLRVGDAAPWLKVGGRVDSPVEADSSGVYRLRGRF